MDVAPVEEVDTKDEIFSTSMQCSVMFIKLDSVVTIFVCKSTSTERWDNSNVISTFQVDYIIKTDVFLIHSKHKTR